MTNFDLVVFGATGFTGQLVAAYLSTHPEVPRIRWAIAGRNRAKLDAVRAKVSPGQAPEVVVADTGNPDSITAMVESARVVLSTAGPYSKLGGSVVVEACAKAGRHYADLSGEYFFQREMIDAFHQTALKTGAKIVHAAGIDSIPSDLGAQLAIERLTAQGARARAIKVLFKDYAGSASGGTMASGRARAELLRSGKYDAAFHRDPYVLVPDPQAARTDTHVAGFRKLHYDSDFGSLGGPFFMAPVNARIVRRSLYLLGQLPCDYSEGISMGAWARVLALMGSRGFGYFVGEPINFKPESGEGPPEWLRNAGHFRARVHAVAEDGHWVQVEVKGRGDPGYLATSKMFSETGLCLALDGDQTPKAGGVSTPAAALGASLRERLCRAEDGRFMQFDVMKSG